MPSNAPEKKDLPGPVASYVRLLIVLLICGGLSFGLLYSASGATLPTSIESTAGALWIVAAVAYGINWIAFIPANAAQTEKYYDLTGSITYLSCTAASLLAGAYGAGSWNFTVRAIVQSCMVVVWCVRLGSFLFARIKKDAKDGRFDDIKVNPPRFLGAWTIQGAWVLITALPVFVVNSMALNKVLGAQDYLGWLVWAIGFGIEVVADNQKGTFAANPANKGRYINEGLWYYSRHPNYFGEMTLWFGQFLAASSVFTGSQWVCVISPLFVVFLLMKVSGVPMLEKRSDEKFAGDKGYELYKENTSVVVIWFKGTKTEVETEKLITANVGGVV